MMFTNNLTHLCLIGVWSCIYGIIINEDEEPTNSGEEEHNRDANEEEEERDADARDQEGDGTTEDEERC